jgi:superfamily II DNA or RNA helicase
MKIDRYSDLNIEDDTLRPYQQKAKKDIFEAWDEVNSVMIQMPTGTGKTRLFTSIIHDINKNSQRRKEPVKILVVAHRAELIDQIDASLKKYSVAHNVIAGGREKNYKYPVSVASIQTITNAKNLEEVKKLNLQFVIIDEAHHALAKTYKKLWDLYPNAKFLGVTATPWRMNHQSFTDLFDRLILSMSIKDFIKQGYLSPYKYFSLKSDSDIQRTIDGIELDKFGEYKEDSMEEKMDIGSIRAQLLDSYLKLAEGKKGIIYAINIAHAKHICEEYQKAGYNAVSIDSKTPAAERQELVQKFKRGEIDIIVNVDIFSEGFDCPDIEFIQLARPTLSLAKYLQQVGRGLRITKDKQHCIILDNVGMYSRFGLPNARRHWKHHFLGKNVDEVPSVGRLLVGGDGKRRDVDMSEGTEDMELIQEIEKLDEEKDLSPATFDDFFPAFGITLGKTTWRDAENLGYTVKQYENGPDRVLRAEDVYFWDNDGSGVFSIMYWSKYNGNFPQTWKSKGFSWDLSYNEWVELLDLLEFDVEITKQPWKDTYQGHKVFRAELKAISIDRMLSFKFDFNYGDEGCYLSSPKTLDTISIEYLGEITKEAISDEHKQNEIIEGLKDVSPATLDDFFPISGIILGKTTWKDVEDLGYKVDADNNGQDRVAEVNNVNFWDKGGKGIFTSMLWTKHGGDFPLAWNSKGFSWELSYNEWIDLFKNMGFNIEITRQPYIMLLEGRDYFCAVFKAFSPDRTLAFELEFFGWKNGAYTTSPNTLYYIRVEYGGKLVTDALPYDHKQKSGEEKTEVTLKKNDEATNAQSRFILTPKSDLVTGQKKSSLSIYEYICSESKIFCNYNGHNCCSVVSTPKGFYLKIIHGDYYFLSEHESDIISGNIWIMNKKERLLSYEIMYSTDGKVGTPFGRFQEDIFNHTITFQDYKTKNSFTIDLETGEKV